MNTDKTIYSLQTKLEEPWVDLPKNEDLSNWGREEEIAYNQMNRQKEKAVFFMRTFDFLTDNRMIGDYYEFGCHRCRTFRMALTEARRHNLDDTKFIAFDSFDGLPEPQYDGIDIWKRGALTTSELDFMSMVKEQGHYLENVSTIKGFYDESLSTSLQKKLIETGRKPMLINIDCDLYESAVPVLKFIEPLLQEGTVIYIDDIFAGYKGSPIKGVARAFNEFRKNTNWKFVKHLDIGWFGRSYIAYQENEANI